MIEPAAGKAKAGRNIFPFEIRQLFKNLLLSEACGEQVQDVDHLNPHPTDTGPPSALCRIDSDAFDKFSHEKHHGRPFQLTPAPYQAAICSKEK